MLYTISTVSTTLGTQEQAQALAEQVVESRTAACVQIDGPIHSVYRWKGKLCSETEYRLTLKTLPALVDNLIEHVRKLHPYQIPELLVSSGKVSADYFGWVQEQVAADSTQTDAR
jgi:periplasmic divalent cation tolerance protein